MRPETNPLDLNNFPDDYSRDHGIQVHEDSSSSAGYRKKKSGVKDGKDDSGKVYECRFCSLKFCKSQALGGHMNRHRQERETETLNRARQLVFSNDNILGQGAHHLGGQPIPPGGYHQTTNIADPSLPFRSVYQTRVFSGSSSSTLLPQPPPPPPPPPQTQQYIYTSPPRLVSYPSQYPPHPMNDYFVGHVLSGNTQYGHPNPVPPPESTNYTCIGAPVGQTFPPISGRGGSDAAVSGGGGGRDMSLQHLDPSAINRFQDRF